jgi:hypothetical protein
MKDLIELKDSKNKMITKGVMYGFKNALRVSGFPMIIEDKEETEEQLLKRAIRLGSTPIGEGHDNFLNGIIIQFDGDFTNKFTVEFQRYHHKDYISSQSLQFTVAKRDETFFDKFTTPKAIEAFLEAKEEYLLNKTQDNYLRLLMSTPNGMKIKAGITTNMRQLKTMYKQRRTHRLPEWQEFCDWCLTIPYFKELCNIKEE